MLGMWEQKNLSLEHSMFLNSGTQILGKETWGSHVGTHNVLQHGNMSSQKGTCGNVMNFQTWECTFGNLYMGTYVSNAFPISTSSPHRFHIINI